MTVIADNMILIIPILEIIIFAVALTLMDERRERRTKERVKR